MRTLTIIYAGLFGLCFGSFANVVIYRVPRGQSLIRPPSKCPVCGARIFLRDLVPLLSWILLLGKCRFCRERISIRYPAVEFLCAALFVAMAAFTGPDLALIPLCLLSFILLCVSVIDIDTHTICDGLIIFGAVLGLIWTSLFATPWYDSLLGALCGALPLLIIDFVVMLVLKKDGFGYGDVKLMAVAGLFLGWRPALAALFFAFVAGGFYAAVLLASGRVKRGAYLAFAPFLSVGVLMALWFSDQLF